ncbi:MAG: HAD family phosphatase [Nanoarchaeota archaeon]
MITTIIWDLDGDLSDTQKLHAKVDSEILARFGVKISPEEITAKYAGVRAEEFFQKLLDTKKAKYDLDALLKEKWRKMETYAQQKVTPIPRAITLVQKLHQAGFKQAVASSSTTKYIQIVLKKLKITSFFEAVTSGEQVKHGKPSPDIFLLAAQRLNSPPECCLVIEDGRNGMLAAERAGMKCIGLVADVQQEYPTKIKVSSLKEMDLEFVRRL